jgi:hypothetical protein
MNLLMAATPIAMRSARTRSPARRWCSSGMCWACSCRASSPARLIRRFGALPVMGVGVLLNALCVMVALSGVDLMQFLVALFALGVGWNFLYTGGTTLFTQTYRPEEKNKAQGRWISVSSRP